MEEIDAGTAAAIIEETQASVADAPPPAPVPQPEVPVDTQLDSEASPPMGEGTAYSKKMSMMEGVIPTNPDRDVYEPESAPSWGQSALWAADEYGVVGNVKRGLDSWISEPEVGDSLKIQDNITDLMIGVPAEYETFIATQRTFDNAERQSERLRLINNRDGFRANEGLGQALTAGVAGFVLDPINLVPGAVMLKGMNMSAKLATAAGLRGVQMTTVRNQVAVWGSFGLAEEMVRALPRLATDETYKIQEYYLDAAMGLAFGAAGPVLGAGFRGFKQGAWVADLAESGAGMATDRAFRQTINTAEALAEQTAESKKVMDKVRSMDVGAAVRTAGEKTKQQTSDKVHDVDRKAFVSGLKESIGAEDLGKVQETTDQFFDRINAAMETREFGPAKFDEAGEQILTPEHAKFREILERARVAAKEKAAKAEKPTNTEHKSGGAAARNTTTADKVGDVVESFRYQARMAKKTIEDVAEASLKALDEVNLSEAATKELDFTIRAGRQAAIDAIDAAAAIKGVRPQRTRLSNKAATQEVTKALYRAQKAISAAFDGIDSSLLPDGVSMPARYKAAIHKAYAKAGIKRKTGETLEQAFEREMGGKSSKMRDATLAVMIQEVDIQITAMKQDLDAMPDVVITDELISQIETARIYADSQLDFVRMLSSNPYTDALVTTVQWAEVSAAWRAQGNMDELGRQFVDSKVQTAVKNQYGRLSESMSSRFMKSGAPLAQWFTHTILEVPSGYGGQIDRNPLTAAIYSENLFNAAKFPVAQSWETLMKETAKAERWGVLQRMANTAGNAKTHKDVTRLSQDVMLEMNARQQGLESKASPAVSKFVDQLDKSYQELHDLQMGHVDGIHAGNKIKNYQHQAWNDAKIIEMIGTPGGRQQMESLFEVGYIKSGMDEGKARVLAKAMIDQKATAAARPRAEIINIGEEELRGSMPQLLEVVERMRKNGDSEEMIQEIVEELNRAAGGETPTYAKNRTPIDLSASISDGQGGILRVVDLMDQDVPATFIKYAKEATGRRAISESSNGMLKSDADMNGMITAMALEAQELGAAVDHRSARIALQQMMGKSYEGQLPMNARRVRDGISLAGMGGLGESQLAEFGLALNRGTAGLVGAMQKWGNVKAKVGQLRGFELTPAQAANREYLSDLQELSGLYQEMYQIDRMNVHFDAAETNTNQLSKLVDTATGGKYRPMLQRMQGKFTGYGAIRQMEDQIAMASLMHDLAKHLDPKRTAFTSAERLRDLGVPDGEGNWLQKLFDENVTFKDDGTIETLNINQWSQIDKAKLGVILNRYASQQVQKGFIGESSPAMMNQWVAFMMQFKSYPMLAAEKQQARHLKFADKEAAMGIMLNTVSSAAARVIRYQSMALAIPDGEDRKSYLEYKYESLAKDTFAYMGVAGMSVSLYETGKGISGNSEYGQYSIANELPVLNYIDGVTKALRDPLKTDSQGRTARNTQNAAPLGTTAQGNILFRILSEMTPDGSDNE